MSLVIRRPLSCLYCDEWRYHTQCIVFRGSISDKCSTVRLKRTVTRSELVKITALLFYLSPLFYFFSVLYPASQALLRHHVINERGKQGVRIVHSEVYRCRRGRGGNMEPWISWIWTSSFQTIHGLTCFECASTTVRFVWPGRITRIHSEDHTSQFCNPYIHQCIWTINFDTNVSNPKINLCPVRF